MNCQPRQVADLGKHYLQYRVVEESGQGWRDSIRRGLSCGHLLVGFGCGDVDIGGRDISSRSVQLVRALQEVAGCRDEVLITLASF